MINLQAAFGSEGAREWLVLYCHASSYSGLAFQKGSTANFYAGDALWRSVWLCRLDLKPKCHGSYPVRGCQIVDEQNVCAFGPRNARDISSPSMGRPVVPKVCGHERSAPPLLDQTLPFAPFGWVPGVVVQASRDRMDHFDADGHNLALQDAFEPQFFATRTDIKVAMGLLMLQSVKP